MRVAWSVLRVARASDVVGTLDDFTVCAVLPDTSAEGVAAFCASVELDPAITAVTYWWTHTPGEKKAGHPDRSQGFASLVRRRVRIGRSPHRYSFDRHRTTNLGPGAVRKSPRRPFEAPADRRGDPGHEPDERRRQSSRGSHAAGAEAPHRFRRPAGETARSASCCPTPTRPAHGISPLRS